MIKNLVIATLLFTLGVQAQELEQGQYPPDYDTNYIKDFRHRFNFSLLFGAKDHTLFGVTPMDKTIRYRANNPLPSYGFMFSYRWANIAITVPVPGLSYYQADKGETRNWNLAIGITGRHAYMRTFVEYFKGYYIANPEVIFNPFDSILNLSVIVPGLESLTYNLSAYYGFNGEKYSHRSLIWQSELQKKSAGTFLVGFIGGYRWVKSDQPFSYREESAGYINTMQYLYVGVNVGYTHTFVLAKNLTLSGMFLPGLNLLYGEYDGPNQSPERIRNGVGVNFEIRVQLLYEIGNIYTGTSLTSYGFSSWVDPNRPVGNSYSYLRLNVGYRFKIKPIKFLKPLGLSN